MRAHHQVGCPQLAFHFRDIKRYIERYKAAKAIESTFSFLWQYPTLTESETKVKAKTFIDRYKDDVSDELVQEIIDLKSIHEANFGEKPLPPLELLNKLHEQKLQSLFVTAPLHYVFSVQFLLKLIKNYLRTTMSQQ